MCAKLVVVALIFLGGCAMNRGISLFGEEFIVRPDGIYTYAHYYEHPETGRRVIIVGTNHAGDREYFEAIARILEKAEVVLYEGPSSTEDEESAEYYKKAGEDVLKKLYSQDPDEAFLAAMTAFFWEGHKHLRLMGEGSAFNHSKPGWESGDAEFFTRLKNDKEWERQFQQKLQTALTPERKREIVEFVRKAVKEMEEGRFTRKDYGDGFVFFWSDKNLVRTILDIYAKSRDEMVMERLDAIVSEKDPDIIGIKFGAGHISYQRKLLEERGYVLQYSTELRNISF